MGVSYNRIFERETERKKEKEIVDWERRPLS